MELYGLAVSGAKTAIIGRNKANMENVVNELTSNALKEHNAAVTIKGYCSDVTDKEELTKTYEAIKAELGSCDILINGAGGNQPGAITSVEMLKKEPEDDDYSFWNLDETKIREVMELNFMGTLLPIQVFTRDMVKKRSGSIINIASVSSILPLVKRYLVFYIFFILYTFHALNKKTTNIPLIASYLSYTFKTAYKKYFLSSYLSPCLVMPSTD